MRAPTKEKDILNGKSPAELLKEINEIVGKDQRSLPSRSKVFAAIAKLQKFDVLPEVGDSSELDKTVKSGGINLNRGMSGTKGIPAIFYAVELIKGAMYPGTLTAVGNGMYFATASVDGTVGAGFDKVSFAAQKYTKGDEPGVLVRAALKSCNCIEECALMGDNMKESRIRAKSAGIADIGAFAAALGYDAIYANGVYEDTKEIVYVVLNRGALIVQKTCLMIKN
jgi:hypothetical protein